MFYMNFTLSKITFLLLFGVSTLFPKTALNQSFSPLNISGLSLWITADTIANDTIIAGNATFIEDRSGNGNNVYQNNVSMAPTFIDSISVLNNHAVFRFDGNNVLFMDSTIIVGTAFIVANWNGGGSLFPEYNGLITQQNNPNDFAIFQAEQGTSRLLYNYTMFAISEYQVNGISQINISPLAQYKIISGSTNNLKIFNNLVIGREGVNNNRTWEGDIAEILIYNRQLNSSEMDSVEFYLYNKYAPPINLGANIYTSNFCNTILKPRKGFTNYLWQDGSTADSLIVSKTGWYSVIATDIFGFSSTDSIYVQFPTISQLVDDTICQGNSIVWNTNLDTAIFNFEWSDSSTDSILTITQPGDYWVKVIDTLGCFQYSDTITIAVDSFPTQTTLGIDKTVCQGENLGLEIGNNVVSYLWSTGDTTAQTIVDTAGFYWVQVQNNVGCVALDTIQISVNGIAPTVLFNAINSCNNSPTLFNNSSFTIDGSNIISSFWTFGTGDTSNLQNPSYQYSTEGNYTITLQIITDSGCTNTLTQQIQVHKKPTAGFFPTYSLMCSTQNALFTNNSFSSDGVINSWLWDFGVAGNTDTSSLQTGNYAYANAGNYSVQLIVSSEFGCRDTALNLINIKLSPTANFNIQDSCLTNQTKFTNLSIGTISNTNWDFGDANSSSLLNPSHVYTNPGSYNVKLSIRATNGCWDTLIKPLTIYDNPIANFITEDYCVLSNYQLVDSSTTNAGNLTSWQWNISSLAFQSNNQNPTINFNYGDSGIYQLKLKVINTFGCKDSVTKTIGVYPLPISNFSFTPEIGLPPLAVNFTNLSYGGSLSYWNFGNGNSSIVNSPTYTYQDLGIYSVTLQTTSIYGCVDSISKTIQIIEPVIDIAVKNIYYEFVSNSNFIKISVQLANEGRVTIKNMDLILQNSSTGSILETWNGNLAPNLQNIYTFSSMIEMPNGEIPSLICVTANNINSGIDANLLNNEFCKALNKFELINIYPNPTSKDLFLEFISPSVSNLEINLFDNSGKFISNLFSGQSSKGINRKGFLMSVYSQGLYIIEIKNNEEIIRKKLVIE